MKIGPMEILVLLVVITVIALATRVIRTNKLSKRASTTTSTTSNPQSGTRKTSPRVKTSLVGIAFIVLGIIILSATIEMFKWVYTGYIWALIILAIGVLLVYLSRKR